MSEALRIGALESQLKGLLEKRRAKSTLRNLTLPAAGLVDFSSNDFLSLATSSQLKDEFHEELRSCDAPQGSGGSRLLDGNSIYAEELEHDIARFHGAEAGLLFNSGFDANAGFFSCVPQPNDWIVYDEYVHASVHDGMRLSRAKGTLSFRHNSVQDLKEVLQKLTDTMASSEHPVGNIIVAVESIYSMDGDVAPLRGIVDTVHNIVGHDRGYIVVDEAHSTGVLGSEGRGLVCQLGLERRILARLHTFGKALASNGAIILGSSTLRHYLINYARPLIYTTFLSYPSLALVRSSYALLWSGRTSLLQEHLQHLTSALFVGLTHLHATSQAARSCLRIPSACPQSPIFGVQLQQPRLMASFLQSQRMMVRAVVPPTVPLGTQRVRICLHAGNTVLEIEELIRAIEWWCDGQMLEVRDEVTRKEETRPML
ncbi:hypothetical protein ACN47E_001638 [Coniothyrium glycines]